MGVDSDDGRIVRHQILALESLHEPLLNLMLVRPPVTHSPPDFLERCGGDGIYRVPRLEMSLDLLFRKSSLEQRYQIARADHIFPEAANQLQRAAVHQRNSENKIIRRILHGDVAML